MSSEETSTSPWNDPDLLTAVKNSLGVTWSQIADLLTTDGLSPADVRDILKGTSGNVDATFTVNKKQLEHWVERGRQPKTCPHPILLCVRVGIDYSASLPAGRIVPADPATRDFNRAAAKAWTEKADEIAESFQKLFREAVGKRGWEFSAKEFLEMFRYTPKTAEQQTTAPTDEAHPGSD